MQNEHEWTTLLLDECDARRSFPLFLVQLKCHVRYWTGPLFTFLHSNTCHSPVKAVVRRPVLQYAPAERMDEFVLKAQPKEFRNDIVGLS